MYVLSDMRYYDRMMHTGIDAYGDTHTAVRPDLLEASIAASNHLARVRNRQRELYVAVFSPMVDLSPDLIDLTDVPVAMPVQEPDSVV